MRLPSLRRLISPLLQSRASRPPSDSPSGSPDDYAQRVLAEQATFKDCLDVNDLPAIYHYWSNTYLRPKLEGLGYSYPEDFFAKSFATCGLDRPERRLLSIGAGNCDTEVRTAQLLVSRGVTNFTIECIDFNRAMLDRGRLLADREGLGAKLEMTIADFNTWEPDGKYDGVMANQSLHHVLDLEHLFDAIARAMAPGALFLTSDMIGRNGHQRWPEALEIVEELYAQIPRKYRYNHQRRVFEEKFVNVDCSTAGFEGIRAQDILPLLVERFHFDTFAPFANVIDPFIDRAFGHNFDQDAEWDRAFIDNVHARDEEAMRIGRIKPTHLIAAMCLDRPSKPRFLDDRPPAECIRRP